MGHVVCCCCYGFKGKIMCALWKISEYPNSNISFETQTRTLIDKMFFASTQAHSRICAGPRLNGEREKERASDNISSYTYLVLGVLR